MNDADFFFEKYKTTVRVLGSLADLAVDRKTELLSIQDQDVPLKQKLMNSGALNEQKNIGAINIDLRSLDQCLKSVNENMDELCGIWEAKAGAKIFEKMYNWILGLDRQIVKVHRYVESSIRLNHRTILDGDVKQRYEAKGALEELGLFHDLLEGYVYVWDDLRYYPQLNCPTIYVCDEHE